MIALFYFVVAVLASPFKPKSRLEAENAVLRHQLIVLRRKVRGRGRLTNTDRWFFVLLYRWFPSILKVVTIVQPETLVHWHRAGFRCYWRWKSRRRGGRPRIEIELRTLIRQMSTQNQLWGAPRIHGELLKLGFSVAQSTVAKYMVKPRGPPSQGWKTFLRNHAPDIAAMDLFDHIIVSGEGHLRRNLISYAAYCNSLRTHRSLHKDAPIFWSDSTDRNHSSTPDPRWASPSLRPGLSLRYTQESSPQSRSLADFIVTTATFKFSVHTARQVDTRGGMLSRATASGRADQESQGSKAKAITVKSPKRSRAPLEIQAKHADGISPGQLRDGAFADPLNSRDMADRIVFSHVKGIIGAHQDAVRPKKVQQVSQLVIAEHYGVEINLPQVGGWRQREGGVAILPSAPGMIDPAGTT